MTMQPFGVDPLILEESDLGTQALFQSFLPQNLNPIQQNQFSSLFQPTFNQFLGQLGSQVRGGKLPGPEQTFSNFLQNQFNPQRQLLRFNSFSSPGQTAFRF